MSTARWRPAGADVTRSMSAPEIPQAGYAPISGITYPSRTNPGVPGRAPPADDSISQSTEPCEDERVHRRSVEELVNVDDPAWPAISALVEKGPTAAVLDVDPQQARKVLECLQVTARSYLGALALNTGGILADGGWFRLLGGGSDKLADLATVNHLNEATDSPPPFLLVGFDALGGRFAVDGGGLGIGAGEVCYFGPDTLSWGGLGGGHAEFVTAAITGELSQSFASLRWPRWEVEVEALRPDQGLSIWPPPFSAEGQDLSGTTRRPVPISELFDFYDDAAGQLGAAGG